jgi:hypothetical protein
LDAGCLALGDALSFISDSGFVCRVLTYIAIIFWGIGIWVALKKVKKFTKNSCKAGMLAYDLVMQDNLLLNSITPT